MTNIKDIEVGDKFTLNLGDWSDEPDPRNIISVWNTGDKVEVVGFSEVRGDVLPVVRNEDDNGLVSTILPNLLEPVEDNTKKGLECIIEDLQEVGYSGIRLDTEKLVKRLDKAIKKYWEGV